MSKEAYYFSHDANARQDEKVLMLRADHGWEGYGIYWALVEMMFENADTALHHNKTKGISVSYNIDITLLEGVINTCITEELFVSDGIKFWSETLRRRKEKFQEIKEKKSAAGKKGMAKRWAKQQENEEKDNTVITDDNTVITKNNKGKEIKERKLNKENNIKDYTSKIKDLSSCFSSIVDFNKLSKKYWDVIRETRTTGKISESVIFNAMSKWTKYDPIVVQYALKTHIEAHAGKKEEYTLGIMRGTTKAEAEDRLNQKVSIGSHTKQNAFKPFDGGIKYPDLVLED